MSEISESNIFEERAENLSRGELLEWSAETERDARILTKLRGAGAKLISGPRGSGKSTLLRKAYFSFFDKPAIVAAYVNYARSLALEPLLFSHSNAIQIFRQWLLYKIVVGIAEFFEDSGRAAPVIIKQLAAQGRTILERLEKGTVEIPPAELLSPTSLVNTIRKCLHDVKALRCVLLLDDAAHAFSPEQQREFFEIFRELKSREIAPKAAVYPGTTTYASNFHIGHDAELIEAWYELDSENYLDVMFDVLERRLPPHILSSLSNKRDLIDLLALASFGIPRGFLTMIADFIGIEDQTAPNLSRRRALAVVSGHVQIVRSLFASLAVKLPRYKNFIEQGRNLENAIVMLIREQNRSRSIGRKQTVVGVAEPIEAELSRVSGDLHSADSRGSCKRMSIYETELRKPASFATSNRILRLA